MRMAGREISQEYGGKRDLSRVEKVESKDLLYVDSRHLFQESRDMSPQEWIYIQQVF